jgi:threonine aldolase
MQTKNDSTSNVKIQAKGVIWCGSAMWQGQFIIRLSVCSWQTNEEDLAKAVAAFKNALTT